VAVSKIQSSNEGSLRKDSTVGLYGTICKNILRSESDLGGWIKLANSENEDLIREWLYFQGSGCYVQLRSTPTDASSWSTATTFNRSNRSTFIFNFEKHSPTRVPYRVAMSNQSATADATAQAASRCVVVICTVTLRHESRTLGELSSSCCSAQSRSQFYRFLPTSSRSGTCGEVRCYCQPCPNTTYGIYCR